MLCRRWWGAKGKRLDQECLLASRRRQPTGSWSDHCANATDASGDDEVFHVHQILPGPGSLFYLKAGDCCTDASTSDSIPGILVGEEARLAGEARLPAQAPFKSGSRARLFGLAASCALGVR